MLVRVEAAGVNRFDVNQRKGGASSFPLVLGNPGDAAGTRADTGERVVAASARGSYAELTVAAAENVFPLPDGVEPAVAAALPTPYRVAWWGVVGRGELGSGGTLLVQGGSSSTGQAAIDIGRSVGATVYATGSPDSHERIRELGAEPLAYDDASLEQLEADVVWEPLGARTFERSVAALGRGGRLVTPGAVGDPRCRSASGRSSASGPGSRARRTGRAAGGGRAPARPGGEGRPAPVGRAGAAARRSGRGPPPDRGRRGHRPRRPEALGAATLGAPRARSSGDRALPCGGRGRKFESCRAHRRGHAVFAGRWRGIGAVAVVRHSCPERPRRLTRVPPRTPGFSSTASA